MRTSSLALGLGLTLAACGGNGGMPDAAAPFADAGPDAPPPDAAPPCPTCSYSPEPLADGDLTAQEMTDLSVRFNPAQVYTNPVLFASPVDYVLEHGGPLKVAKVLQKGPYWMKLDEANATTVTGYNLMTDDWSTLPVKDGQGNDLAYFMDSPGDNGGPEENNETWTAAWQAAGGPAYPPTHYAHFFWLSKADGYLAIQYWFFYPFNKFGNNHEGDWEHMNAIVQKQADNDWHLVMAHFSFHARQIGLTADKLVRLADNGGGNGDHVVVFTGGHTCAQWGDPTQWCGTASGATYPFPGAYPYGATAEVAAGGTSIPSSNIKRPEEFTVIILPREDQPVPPNLSWYKLPFFVGQLEVLQNANVVIAQSSHRAPLVPNHFHFEFEEAIPQPYDPFGSGTASPEKFTPPGGWTMINNPDPSNL
jgi:hypothetical protein